MDKKLNRALQRMITPGALSSRHITEAEIYKARARHADPKVREAVENLAAISARRQRLENSVLSKFPRDSGVHAGRSEAEFLMHDNAHSMGTGGSHEEVTSQINYKQFLDFETVGPPSDGPTTPDARIIREEHLKPLPIVGRIGDE